MYKQSFIFLSLILQMQLVHGFTPSVESLFRNGSNGDIDQKTVAANLLIESLKKEVTSEINDTGDASERAVNDLSLKLNLPRYTTVKLLFYNEGQRYPKLLQLDYADGSFANSKRANLHFKNSLRLNSLGLSEENIDARFFYAVMSSLLNNNGSLMIELAKSLGSNIKFNKELINQEKYQLLGRYKRYLEKKIQSNEDQAIKSPLVSDDTDKQSLINEIMSQKFYHESSNVSQVKEGDDFYWVVSDSILTAKFTDNNRHLKFIKIKTPSGIIEMVFRDYILYKSIHEFPREILFKTSLGDEFKISLKKLSVFEDSSDQLRRRVQRYKKSIQENNIQKAQLKPPFLM